MQLQDEVDRPGASEANQRTALVLGGGGARGAYEAGVIGYLREELEPKLDGPLRLDLLCGTSVGAITACVLASSAHRPEQQGALLRELWSKLQLDQVLRIRTADVGRSLWELGGGGLVDPSGLRRLLLREIGWPSIGRNLRAHRLAGLCVSTTRVSDGKSCLFVQRAPGEPPLWIDDRRLEVASARISARHALASAAMPLLFAPVELDGQLHVDGGLRLNVPLSPALRLGAGRVIVVSLQPQVPWSFNAPDEPLGVTALFLAGKALNALMQDRVEQDLGELNRLNDVVEAGRDAFGPKFLPRLGRALALRQRKALRDVRSLVVRPSRDLGLIASRVINGASFCRRNRTFSSLLLALLAGRDSERAADLASYLLFDADYAEELISLGRADARSREAEWWRFLGPPAVEARGNAEALRVGSER